MIVAGGGLAALVLGYWFTELTLRPILVAAFFVLGTVLLLLPYSIAIRILFCYLGVEGMMKLLTHYNPIVHVGPDLLMLALNLRWFLAFMLGKEKIQSDRPPMLAIFALYFAWFLIEFFNPYALGLIPSMAGYKVYISMALLYVYGYYLAKNPREIRIYMGIWLGLGALNAGLGLFQSAIGPASVLMLSSAYAEPLRKFNGYAFRPFGTTHSAGGAGLFPYLSTPFLVYFVFYFRSFWKKALLSLLLPAFVATIFLSQVRVFLLKSILGVSFFFGLAVIHSPARARKAIAGTVVAACVLLALVLPRLMKTWIDISPRNAEGIARTMTLFDYSNVSTARAGAGERILAYAEMVPFGAGLSRTGAAAGAFSELNDADEQFPYGFFGDNFWAATVAEIGVPGSLLMTILVFGLLGLGFRGLRRSRDPESIPLMAVILASLAMVVVGFWGSEAILYNPESAYFWFFSGVLMRLSSVNYGPRHATP